MTIAVIIAMTMTMTMTMTIIMITVKYECKSSMLCKYNTKCRVKTPVEFIS